MQSIKKNKESKFFFYLLINIYLMIKTYALLLN
jgi:hypothetical protein